MMVCSMIDFMIEIKKNTKVSKGLSLRKIYTITHTPKCFQPTPNFCTLCGHFSRVTGELIFHSKHLAIERNILFEFL